MYGKPVETHGENIFKRITSAIVLVAYVLVISPISLFAQNFDGGHTGRSVLIEKEEKAEVLITALKGGTVTLGDASIEIPEGALKEDTLISITRLSKVEDTGESLYNAIPRSGGYRFLPAGTKFEKDVTITLPYSAELNSKPQSLEELYTYFFDTEKKCWTKLERLEVDKENLKVRSLSSHFTDMINATLTLPESAGPIDVNLNSIKNLEAAKPDGHLIKFNPPNAGPMGDASFSFDLGIPSGRHGMQPQVSVSYSSGGGGGIMGKGFDVSYGSSITTDTRKGLPNYDTHDIYMLDGITLEEKTRDGTEITYRPQKESSFSRIIRYGAGSPDDYWEVTDKSGTKRIYAQSESSCTGCGVNTFTWNLTEIKDVHGNNIIYEYENSGGYVYPSAIYYTGFGGKKGNYCVRFHYDAAGNEPRKDVRTDARSKKIISCGRLLTCITTHYNGAAADSDRIHTYYNPGETIRSYTFKYTEGLAKEKMLVSLAVSNNAGESYDYSFAYEELKLDGNGNPVFFANPVRWLNGYALNETGGKSSGENVHASAGVGVGTETFDARATGGVTGSVSSSTGYTRQTLMDIDGDGKCESVAQKGNSLVIYRQNSKGDGFEKDPETVTLPLPSDGTFLLSKEKSSSDSFGWNVYGGAGSTGGIASEGYIYSSVTQNGTNSLYTGFYDMDGDGLVDIVTGADEYLHNDTEEGNPVSFSKRYIINYPKSYVRDLGDKLPEYRKSYALQRPFAAWEPLYDGVVTAKGGDLRNGSSKVKCVIGDEEVLLGEGMNVEQGELLYFIPDMGESPTLEQLNTVMSWENTVAYTEAKVFGRKLEMPIYFPNDTYNNVSGLENLYGTDKKLKGNFQSLLTGKERKILFEEGLFIPGVLSEDLFGKLKEHIGKMCPQALAVSAENTEAFYQKFAEAYTYSVADRMFHLTKTSVDRNFFNTYIKGFFDGENLSDMISCYSSNGITADLTGDVPAYRKSSEESYVQTPRIQGGVPVPGSFFARDGRNLLNVGRIQGKDILIDTDTQQIVSPNDADEKIIVKKFANDKCVLDIGDGRYTVTYEFKGRISCADMISDGERSLLTSYLKDKYPDTNLSADDFYGEDNRLKSKYRNLTTADENYVKLISACSDLRIYRYQSVSMIVDYSHDALYDVDGGNVTLIEPETSSSTALVMTSPTLEFPDGHSTFSTKADFSAENLADSKKEILCLYKHSGSQEITVQTKEFLYGGMYGWFYGIWTGSEGEHPFTETNIAGTFRNPDGADDCEEYVSGKKLSEDEIQEAGKSKADELSSQGDQAKPSYTFSGYLPVKKVEKDGTQLCGTVSEYMEETVRDDNGALASTSEKISSSPYIAAGSIRCNRLGGNAYFLIEGIPGNGASSTRAIQKTVSTGTDVTSGPQVSVLSLSTPTVTENEGNAWMMQSLQDVNSDRIPDALKIVEEKCHVYFGSVNPQGDIVYPSEPSLITGIVTSLSKNHNESNSTGFSFSPAGAIQTIYSASGKQKGISLTNGIGGSFFNGTNGTTASMLDINGDGIADYIDGGTVYLGKGDGYEKAFEYGWESISEGSVSGHSTNLSIGQSLPLGGTSGNASQNISVGVSVSGDVGGCLSVSSSVQERMLTDVNGDGLVDVILMADEQDDPDNSVYDVYFNTGSEICSTEAPFKLRIPKWKNKSPGCIEMSNRAINSNEISYGGTDVQLEDSTSVELKDFAKDIEGVDCSITASVNVSGNLGVNVSVSIPIGVIKMNITGNVGGGINSGSSSTSATVKMIDLDGDGLADHVLNVAGDGIWWKRNLSGRLGLLNKIILPQGGNIEIKYAEKYGTRNNPNFKYVMSEVTINDGTDGKGELTKLEHGFHFVTTSYTYDGGYYDRKRKDFYGFRKVSSTFADGAEQLDEYYNREYYSKGMTERTSFFSKDGILLSKSETELCPVPCAMPKKEDSWTYEKESGVSSIHTYSEYKYDSMGNCTDITQSFDDGTTLRAEIKYEDKSSSDYIMGLPVDIKVYGKNGTQLLRHRAGKYDGKGQLEKLYQYYDKNGYTENVLSYDGYGNIKSVSDSRGAKISYEYDVNFENMFIIGISQSGSGTETYTGKVEYDIDRQTKRSETDCNGNTMRYEYDGWQRVKEIFTSYDGEIPAVSYEYHTPTESVDGKRDLWYALTCNKVTFDSKDGSVIRTVLQTDGLGRTVRTAKTGCVNGEDGWNASGAVEYDGKGRTVKAGMTEFIKGDVEALLASAPKMTGLFTSYEYDDRDRQTKTILPDGAVQTAEFEIKDGKLISNSTDPLGNVSVQETDSHGNIVRVARKDSDGKQLTEVTYRYNEMGEMLKAFDAKGHPVSVEYDLLGRRTSLESLDSGRQEFFYDKCSNLVRENNSVLREHNKQIVYEYDGLNRLLRIDYPDTEDTIYTYGRANDPCGAAGKILSVSDASGTVSYEYGKLGEVTKETRTLATHLGGKNKTETAVMKYRSDYLGRMQWIVYPDGEEITYGYDNGGQVVSVTGEHWGQEFKYVTNILYDKYGQRTKIVYGNGTSTDYTYDPARRWLDTIKTVNTKGKTFQNIAYSFDAVGNVLGYENDCLDSARGNYKTSQTYSYDSLYQLVKVEGKTVYNPYQSVQPEFMSDYSQVFEFDSDGLGNMTGKVSKESVSPQISVGDNLNYDFKYVYDKDYTNRLVSAGDRYYKYDSNGNITCEQDGKFDGDGPVSYHRITQEAENVFSTDYGWGLFREKSSGRKGSVQNYRRTYTWDERNRLISSVDANCSTSYIYGQDGQRSNKYTESSETLYFNKMWTLHTDSGNSADGGQLVKNVYLGETRIVTKLHGANENTPHEELYKQYFYHSDHLGSASLITDYKGDEYQRIEYTPYGETWVEKTENVGLEFLPYKFTGKEMDEETGLYYYGARYLDPKYSRWISTDPALGEYIPAAGKGNSENAGNLPGMGGIYNHINGRLYHYAGNNPVRYIDPDGRTDFIYTLDEDGNKTITEENNWGIWELLHRDRYFVQTADGTRYKANSKETVELYDWKKIDTDFLDDTFNDLIDNANEKDTNFKRILDESVGGELDFKLSMEEDTLYYNGEVLYNRNEAGNFVWTYFLETHGYHFLHGPLAQAGSIIHGRLDEWHDTKARWVGNVYYWKIRFTGEKK